MFTNYLKIAWRSVLHNKVYSSINILGLALGMAVSLVIGLWVWDELTFNRYHENHSRLAQVMTNETNNGEVMTGEQIAIPLRNELTSKYGDAFENLSLASGNYPEIISSPDKTISAKGVWAEESFPEMLTLKMISGQKDALKDISSVLISKSLAQTLFGNAEPVGQTLRIKSEFDFRVAGVFEDLPKNTTLSDMKFLLPWKKFVTSQGWIKEAQDNWGNHSFWMYVQLKDGTGFSQINSKIKDIVKPYTDKVSNEEVFLHPMNQWHLYSQFKNGKATAGRIRLIWLFGTIGVFVLLLACINFMNLSTARSEKRAKEVGVRKAIGSMRSQLIGQFLSESLLVTSIALLAAIAIVAISLPWFNNFADKQLSLPFGSVFFWCVLIGSTLFVSLVAGSYPAFYLSGFKTIKVLKGSVKLGRFASVPRKVLVVIQFTVSVSLIIGTIIVYRQIQFAKNRPVGYTREGLVSVTINTDELYNAPYNAIRNDLLNTGMVENMSASSSPLTDIHSNWTNFSWKGKDPNSSLSFGVVAVSHDHGKTIGWEIKEGRDYSRTSATDTGALILNEAAVKLMRLKQPVGEIIKWINGDHKVVGVVKDMVMESPYTPVKPTVFFLQYGWSSYINIRIKPAASMSQALGGIESVIKKYNPGGIFEYKFVDEDYAKKFSDEERIGKLARLFAILTIFISCLGLFGLASFVAEQRSKEISIRKVLGATVFNLWKMLSKDFVILVIVSCFVAIPIAWYFLGQWLQGYEYRTEISWWVFGAAGFAALLITLLTVSFQAIKAAVANPVKSLRAE